MKRKLPAILAACLLSASIALGIAGCGTGETASTTTASQTEPTNRAETFADAKLIDDLAAESPNENCILSAVSMDYALAMLLEGADGASAEALRQYFAQRTAPEQLSQMQKTYAQNEEMQLRIAGGIWTDRTLPLKQTYCDSIKARYQAEAASLDFQDPAAAQHINDWVKAHTEGLISGLIDNPESLQRMRTVLVNTLYFKGVWEEPFAASATQKAVFTAFDGTQEEVDMMSGTEARYLENEAATGFLKSYAGGLCFVGILPKQAGAFSLESLEIADLVQHPSEETVHIQMPKLELSDTRDCTEAVRDTLGLGALLDPDTADFSKMSEASLCVDTILQKTRIRIDEQGTEAAAATGVMLKETAVEETKAVLLNRPFAFGIYDESTGSFLFLGKIVSAKAG